jgi:hypothetical protein
MTDCKENDESGPAGTVPEGAGVDARRKADRVAEEAGRKAREEAAARGEQPKETGGPEGLEPTRYGDWEKAGRCTDF